MKYLQSFELYNINENFDYNLLLENNKYNLYKRVQDKTIRKLRLNLYFVGTFQMGVVVLYPVVEALVKKSNIPDITPEQIVLLTIFSIAQILNVFDSDVKRVRQELEKEGIMHLVEHVKNSLQSIYKIFSFVSRSFGKIVDVFTDMLAYVALSAPTYMAIVELVSKDGLNLETLPQKVLIFGAGAAAFTFKSLIETIITIVKNKIKKS
jgi:hypothetical protein